MFKVVNQFTKRKPDEIVNPLCSCKVLMEKPFMSKNNFFNY